MSDDHRPADFSEPMMWPRYTGIPTFMRTPFAESLDDVDIGLIGVPFDGGVTNRTGARHGPREIRNQSSLTRRINQSTKVAPHDLCRVCDVGDAPIRSPFHLESSLDEIEQAFARLHDAGVVPVARRRPLHHPAHLPGHREGTVRSAWCTSMPTATPMTTTSARSSTTARRFAARSRRDCSTRTAPSRIGIRGGVSRHRRMEVQPRQRDARGVHGGAVRARLARGDRGGARHRGRRPDLRELRRRRARSLCTRPVPAPRRWEASRPSRPSS